MARFSCRACRAEGLLDDDAPRRCPVCGSTDVQAAYSVDALPDDHPLNLVLTEFAEVAGLTQTDNDDDPGGAR